MTSPICSHCSLMGIIFCGMKNGTKEPLDSRKRSWTRHNPINTTRKRGDVGKSCTSQLCLLRNWNIVAIPEGKWEGVCAWLSLIHNNRHRRRSEFVFPRRSPNSALCSTRRVAGHRWEVRGSGSRNGSVWEHCSDDLDYFRPNLCSVSYCTHLGWMIFLANVSASNYFQIRCGQLQI